MYIQVVEPLRLGGLWLMQRKRTSMVAPPCIQHACKPGRQDDVVWIVGIAVGRELSSTDGRPGRAGGAWAYAVASELEVRNWVEQERLRSAKMECRVDWMFG